MDDPKNILEAALPLVTRDLALEVDRLTRELAQAQAREMALREALRDSVDGWCDARYVYQSARDYLEVAEAALVAPTTGWPDSVKALMRAAKSARIGLIAARDLGIKSAPNPLPALEQALAPFEGVE